MKRGRLQTEQRILEAVAEILLQQGYPEIGVNAIARQAGCDKVLIYRYFGGLDELLLAFAETQELWWEVSEIIPEESIDCAEIPLPKFLELLLNRYVDALEARPLTLEIMAWEMSAENNLTRHLSRVRSESEVCSWSSKSAIFTSSPISILAELSGCSVRPSTT